MPVTDDMMRATNQIGLATWFGGALMGAVGLEGAAEGVGSEEQRTEIERRGWGRWTPYQTAAIGSYVASAVVIMFRNKGRVAAQRGVMSASITKGALTAAALGATAYARYLGRKVGERDGQAESARTQLKVVQWAVPVLTGALLVADAKLGEQQRPAQVAVGVVKRLLPDVVADHLAA